MATIPVYKPQTPFLGLIPGGFRPSLMVRMKGKITTRRGRCQINFINSPALDIGQDVIFHLSIRMDEKVIVRNSYKNKQWELEERYGAFRISYQVPFEIIILAEFEHYKIAINGVHLGVFRHRLPLNLVQYIQVLGDVEIEHILFEQDVKSAQQQAALGALVNGIPAFQIGNGYTIRTSTVVQPSSFQAVSSSTTAVMAPQVPSATPLYPIIPGPSVPPPPYNQATGYSTANVPNDLPPPYQPTAPPQPQQQSDVWVYRKF